VKLQIASRIAIFALLELARRSDRQLSVVEIGEKYKLSSHHLAKVMNLLGRAGLVRAVRGAGGGYQFIGNARRTTLLDVIQIFEDYGSDEGQMGEPANGTLEGVVLQQVLGEIDDIARATFGSITIATMLKLLDRQNDQHAASEMSRTAKPAGGRRGAVRLRKARRRI
jgi:Rrf2 family protein